ncbi:hypothetical protein NBRC10513_000671 [Rhodotorula toruloides]
MRVPPFRALVGVVGVVSLLATSWAADHGQDDLLQNLTPRELRNPISVMLNPTSRNQLVAAHNTYLQTTPVPPQQLQGWLQQRVPSLAACYALDPTIPPLFPVQPLLTALAAHNGANPVPIYLMVLACLPFSPPRNVHPLDPRAPPGPTTDFVLGLRDILRDLAPEWVLAVICVHPSRDAVVKRAADLPNLRFLVPPLFSVFLASIRAYFNVDIVEVQLGGDFARRFARLLPWTDSIDLASLWIDSRFFGGLIQQNYHPRIIMTSRYRQLRSLLVLRQCLYLLLLFPGVLPLAIIYHRLAAYLDIELDNLNYVSNAMGLDLTNVQAALLVVSQAIKAFVRRNGTGTHNGRGSPPRYRNLLSNPGGCAKTSTQVPTPARFTAIDKDLVAALNDFGGIRDAMNQAGYAWIDDADNEELTEIYREYMPLLRVKARISAFFPQLASLADSSLAISNPVFSDTLIRILDSTLSPNEKLQTAEQYFAHPDAPPSLPPEPNSIRPGDLRPSSFTSGPLPPSIPSASTSAPKRSRYVPPKKWLNAKNPADPNNLSEAVTKYKLLMSLVTEEQAQATKAPIVLKNGKRGRFHWQSRLSPVFTKLVAQLASTTPGYNPPRTSQTHKLVKVGSFANWAARLDPPTWEKAFREMNLRLVPSPTFGTPEQRTNIVNFLDNSSSWQNGMPTADWADIDKISVEERLIWICLLEHGGVVFTDVGWHVPREQIKSAEYVESDDEDGEEDEDEGDDEEDEGEPDETEGDESSENMQEDG